MQLKHKTETSLLVHNKSPPSIMGFIFRHQGQKVYTERLNRGLIYYALLKLFLDFDYSSLNRGSPLNSWLYCMVGGGESGHENHLYQVG